MSLCIQTGKQCDWRFIAMGAMYRRIMMCFTCFSRREE